MPTKALHAMLVIALLYVCALNVLIVHNLYLHYGKRVLSIPSSEPPHISRTAHNHSKSPKETPDSSCPERKRAVAVLCTPVTGTNDPTAHMPIFAQLRMAFRVAEDPPPVLFLAVSTDNFMQFHRSWCSSLYSQSKQKTTCHLLLQDRAPGIHSVLKTALQQEPCLSHMTTFPDDASISSHWLANVQSLPRNKVTCLARMDVFVKETAPGSNMRVCSAPAYSMPRRFMLEFAASDGTYSVDASARQWKMFHGNSVLIQRKL